MPLFLLIRHGENDYMKKGRLAGRMPGVHLNQTGRSQAAALAEKLAKTPIKAVYSSPLERAVETAEPLVKALGLEIVVSSALLETDYGEWQGKTLKSLRRLKLWRTIQLAPSLARFPGGESFAECQHRVCQELERLTAQYDAQDVIACVFHADPIKLAVAYYIGLPLDHFQRLSSAPASITSLQISAEGSRLLALNCDVSLPLPKP